MLLATEILRLMIVFRLILYTENKNNKFIINEYQISVISYAEFI